jgi:hypothetical protein
MVLKGTEQPTFRTVKAGCPQSKLTSWRQIPEPMPGNPQNGVRTAEKLYIDFLNCTNHARLITFGGGC